MSARLATAGVAMVFLALVTCSPMAPRRGAPPRPSGLAPRPDAAVGAPPPARDELPSLDALAAGGAVDAPLMREVLRASDAATRRFELEAKAADSCFRAVIAASSPARAWFEDDRGAKRGEASIGDGPVPPRGPACARKGEILRLVVEASGPGASTRAVVWSAP